jgi:hypothetical protein
LIASTNINAIGKFTTRRTQSSDHYFVIGFLLLDFFNCVSTLQLKYPFPSIIKYGLVFLALAAIFYKFGDSNILRNFYGYKKAKFVLLFFCIRTVYLVLFSVEISGSFIQKALIHQLYFMPYFIPPFILLSRFKISFFKYIFKISYLLLYISLVINCGIIITGINPEFYLEATSIMMLVSLSGSSLLMISHLYRNKRIFNLSLLNTILSLIVFAFFGRRGAVIIIAGTLLFVLIIRFRSKLVSAAKKKFYLASALLLTGVIFVFLPFLNNNIPFLQRGFTEDDIEDSRGRVFEDFFSDFTSRTDWIFGRGLNGTVLRSISETGRSENIENGYLSLILKGGLLYLIPVILLFMRAIYLGYFKTNNDLTKALAASILIQFIAMFLFGIPEFSSGYFFIWICASACYSIELRKITNIDIVNTFNR